MLNHQTILPCSLRTAAILFVLIGTLFTITGCLQLYKTIGLTDDQVQDQLTKDQDSRQKIIQQVRFTTTEIITTALAGIGTIASGILAKWLGTERKITSTLISAVESTKNPDLKETIKNKATSAGIEPKLHKRVSALT